MFLVIVLKQQQYVKGHTSVWAVSSKTSDRLLYNGPLLCGFNVPING